MCSQRCRDNRSEAGMRHGTQLIVALDVDALEQALRLADAIGPAVEWYKVGKQLFTRYGPEAVRALKAMGKNVFLDMKYHDIPNTAAQAVLAASAIGADMTNVHAAGGPTMLCAAADAAKHGGILTVAVTVLTSLNAKELSAAGCPDPPARQVTRLATLARQCGIAGVVCSAWEIDQIRQTCGTDFVLVVPGIRPAGADRGDQERVMTPGDAVAAGADFIVVGRPITRAPSPARAAQAIREEMRQAGGQAMA